MYSSDRDSYYSVRAMNIIDYEKKCRENLIRRLPSLKLPLISLETLINECKLRTDINAVEYDTYSSTHFLKGLQILSFETGRISSKTIISYLYLKKKLLIALKDNLFNEYIEVLRKTSSTGLNSSEVEGLIKKFLKVCNVLQPHTELTADEAHQYEFIAELLNCCYKVNVQDSHLVMALVKMAIDRHMINPFDRRFVQQPSYPQGFFGYILKHTIKENFDVISYCSDHSSTLWEYWRYFSVINAVSIGNYDRVMTLLKYGFEIVPERVMKRSGHGFPLIEEVIPRTHRMILLMMSSIRSVNLKVLRCVPTYNNGLSTAASNQKECFRLIWRAIPQSFIQCEELESNIELENSLLAQNGVLRPKRFNENIEFCKMYKNCVRNCAWITKAPRSLKHLSRCAIRKSLKESWNLPHGISQLSLPKTLEQYLDLEIE